MTFENFADVIKDTCRSFQTEVICGDDVSAVQPLKSSAPTHEVNPCEQEADTVREGGDLALEDFDLVAG